MFLRAIASVIRVSKLLWALPQGLIYYKHISKSIILKTLHKLSFRYFCFRNILPRMLSSWFLIYLNYTPFFNFESKTCLFMKLDHCSCIVNRFWGKTNHQQFSSVGTTSPIFLIEGIGLVCCP